MQQAILEPELFIVLGVIAVACFLLIRGNRSAPKKPRGGRSHRGGSAHGWDDGGGGGFDGGCGGE